MADPAIYAGALIPCPADKAGLEGVIAIGKPVPSAMRTLRCRTVAGAGLAAGRLQTAFRLDLDAREGFLDLPVTMGR